MVTKAGYWHEYEVKLSARDFDADFDKTAKHRALEARTANAPKSFHYVMPTDIAENVNVPEYAGLITVERRGRWLKFGIVKPAPINKASKKWEEVQVLRFANALYYRWWDIAMKAR